MDEFVGQSHLLGTLPVVVVCLNVPEPPAGQPALMTIDEVRTGFHEFGHALHGLFSDTVYPRLQGTSVPRDFVEFPSQVNEMWACWPEVLAHYAVHHETGEPLAQDVVDRLVASAGARPGLRDGGDARGGPARPGVAPARCRPRTPSTPSDVEEFETQALTRHGVRSALVPPRYRTGYFAHVFAGGYDAGYYSYLWSEVLDADMVDWFTENGGLTRANGDRFREQLLVGRRHGRPARRVRRRAGPRPEHRAAAASPGPAWLTSASYGVRAGPAAGGRRADRLLGHEVLLLVAEATTRRSCTRLATDIGEAREGGRRRARPRPSTCSPGCGTTHPTTSPTSGTPWSAALQGLADAFRESGAAPATSRAARSPRA